MSYWTMTDIPLETALKPGLVKFYYIWSLSIDCQPQEDHRLLSSVFWWLWHLWLLRLHNAPFLAEYAVTHGLKGECNISLKCFHHFISNVFHAEDLFTCELWIVLSSRIFIVCITDRCIPTYKNNKFQLWYNHMYIRKTLHQKDVHRAKSQ